MTTKMNFEQARQRFAKFGRCTHDKKFHSTFMIPNTNVRLTDCQVCSKNISKEYVAEQHPKL